MLARIIAIESGEQYTDKARRVTIQFDDGAMCRDKVTLRADVLGLADVSLDKVLVVEFTAQGGN